jgi:hypothetical protein
MNLFNLKRNKANERFYLLPGQGGAAFRRKQRYLITCSIIIGVLLSGLLGALMYWMNRPQH